MNKKNQFKKNEKNKPLSEIKKMEKIIREEIEYAIKNKKDRLNYKVVRENKMIKKNKKRKNNI